MENKQNNEVKQDLPKQPKKPTRPKPNRNKARRKRKNKQLIDIINLNPNNIIHTSNPKYGPNISNQKRIGRVKSETGWKDYHKYRTEYKPKKKRSKPK